MATTIALSSDLDLILTKLAEAGVRHPVTLAKTLLGSEIVITLSMGTDSETPTATLSVVGTHEWPFKDEPDRIFDDRSLV